MAVQLRFTQGATVGTWGQPLVVSPGTAVTIDGQATAGTVIASWQILAHYAWDHDTITPTPSTPVVLASGTDATPVGSLTPARPGAYLLELRTWATAGGTGTITRDIRELRAGYTNLADCAPAAILSSDLKTLIDAQVTAGGGRHDNFAAYTWGYAGGPSGPGLADSLYAGLEALIVAHAATAAAVVTAQAAADSAQSDVDDVYEIAAPLDTAWSSAVITLDRSRTIVYSGADASVELSGLGPHTPGAVVSVLFQAGDITGANVVTIADSLGPLNSQNDGEEFDSSLDYRVIMTALSSTEVVSSARAEVVRDLVAPTITAASVGSADTDAVAVTTSESVTWAATTGFSISGHTITGVSGSGTSWVLQLGEPMVVGESVSLVWDETNVVVDGSGNPLAADSIAITNNIGYPAISAAAVDGTEFTFTFDEACNVTGIVGLTLNGTSSVFASVTSGSGTTTVVCALDVAVDSAETITLDVAGANNVTSVSSGLSLQAISGVSVTNNTASAAIWSDDFDRADETPITGWSSLDSATANLVSGALRRTDTTGYQVLYTATSESLPANHTISWTIPHSRLSDGYWGIGTRYDTSDSSTVELFFTDSSTVAVYEETGFGNAVTVTVTDGFPASWSVDQDHTIALELIAGAGRVLLDGAEYGTFTTTVGVGEAGLAITITGEGGNRDWLDVTITAAS